MDDGRKKRKTSARHTKTGKKCPRQSEQWKRLWADPVTREKLLANNRKNARDPNKRSRLGIPDGMRKDEAEAAHAKARVSAINKVQKMKDKGVVEGNLDERAEKALETAVFILEKPGEDRTKLAAARLLLDFLKSKPATKQDITVNKAEEWLKAVAEDDDEQKETPGDEEETS